jgi:PAS domain S-box-containing protein
MADSPRGAVDKPGSEVRHGQLCDAVAFVGPDGSILLTNRVEELPASPPHVRMTEIRDAHGEITGYIGIHRAVTERKQADAELAFHASLRANIDDGVIATDAEDFRIVSWNRGAERMYGFTAEEVLGVPAREVASFPGDQARLRLEQELLETSRTRIEFTAHRKDGSAIEVELIAAAVKDEHGETSGYLGIHRDITERKRAAATLATAASEQTLLTDLSLRALSADDLQTLLDDAVRLVADVLQVELAEIAEFEPADGRLSWRAAFGWSADEIASAAPCPAGTGSLVGYAFLLGEPVISDNVAGDERFRVSSLLAQRAPVSAAAVVIPGQHDPYGALAVIAREPRTFGSRDIEFVQAVANVIGIAVERSALDDRLDAARQAERTRIARALHDGGLRELSDALSMATLARSGAADAGDQQRWAELITSLARVGQQLRGAIYDLRLGTHEDRKFPRLVDELGDRPEGVGYLLKDRVADTESFVDAVRRAARGGSVIDAEVVGRLVGRRRRRDPLDELTCREREVLVEMAEGKSNLEVAEKLVVTVSAVERHVTSIFAKLDLPSDGPGHRRVLAVLRYLHH